MRDQCVLMTACERWENWRQTHNYAYLMARRNTVVFVQPAPTYEARADRGETRWAYLKRFLQLEFSWEAENLGVIESPPMLPSAVSILSRFFGPSIRHASIVWSKRLQATLLRRRLTKLGLAPTVLSIWHPYDLILAGRMGEKVSSWVVYDEVGDFPKNHSTRGTIEKIEADHRGNVDFVFASSRTMYERRTGLGLNISLIPNGADFPSFNRALTGELAEPSDLKAIPRPRLGLIAGLGWAMDYDLLADLADRNPQWSIVMIGALRDSGRAGVNRVTARPNGYWLGYKPQPDLPAYVAGFDVGLMPYRIVDSIRSGYPLKLHEYLAAGLAVVSTMLPEAMPFGDVVGFADGIDAFERVVAEALATNSEDKVRQRVTVARENSWENRFAEMEACLDRGLASESNRGRAVPVPSARRGVT